jgi:uncharacterized protein (DUF1330 family)
MTKGYWVGRLDVTDPEGYKAYVAANAEPFRRHGARFLVRGGRFETPEGDSRSRNVLLEFADFATALACYRSAEYMAAKTLRDGKAVSDLIVIEGHDTPQAKAADLTAKGYWIARVDVTEPAGYQAYVAADGEAFARYGARFLVRGGKFEAVEGASRSRNIVIEFADLAAAQACYRSPEYQRAAALRHGKAIFDLIIIEGYVGPQPGDGAR